MIREDKDMTFASTDDPVLDTSNSGIFDQLDLMSKPPARLNQDTPLYDSVYYESKK